MKPGDASQDELDDYFRRRDEIGLKAAAAIIVVGSIHAWAWKGRGVVPMDAEVSLGLCLLERDDEFPVRRRND